MHNIMVTGGAGFIGSHFVRFHENNPDVRIVVIDKLTYCSCLNNIQEFIDNGKILFYRRDIIDKELLNIMIHRNIEYVVNFAAETHVDRSIKDPRTFLETDVLGLFNLIQCSKKVGVKRFLHISTDEVYGPILQGSADELFPLNPTSPYSASKAAADMLLLMYYGTYDFPILIARPCNQFGIYQYPEKLIPVTIIRLLKGEKAILHGKGQEVREWMWVEECIRHLNDILWQGEIGQIYNVGSGYRISNFEMIGKIMAILDKDQGQLEFIPNRPSNDRRYAINSERLKNLRGFQFYSYFINMMDSLLTNIISWYKRNPDWWGEVDLGYNIYKFEEEFLK